MYDYVYVYVSQIIINFQVSAIIVSRPSSNISENNDAHLGVNLVLGADKIVGYLICPVIAIKWTLKRTLSFKSVLEVVEKYYENMKCILLIKGKGVSFHVSCTS